MEQNRTNNYKFIEHEAVMYEGSIARIEDRAMWHDGRNIYLIQTPNHMFKYVFEENLERYIG